MCASSVKWSGKMKKMKKLESAEETEGRRAIRAPADAEEGVQEKQADRGRKQTNRGAEIRNATVARGVQLASRLLLWVNTRLLFFVARREEIKDFWSAASSTNTHFVPRCNLKALVARARQPPQVRCRSRVPLMWHTEAEALGTEKCWGRQKNNNNKESFKCLKKVWCNMSLFCSFCRNRRWGLWWTKAFPAQMSLLNLFSCSQQ